MLIYGAYLKLQGKVSKHSLSFCIKKHNNRKFMTPHNAVILVALYPSKSGNLAISTILYSYQFILFV